MTRPLRLDEERSVLAGIVAGKTNRTIAEDLGIPYGTVRDRVRRILADLGATSRLQAALAAVREQVGPLEEPEPEMTVLSIREDGSVQEHRIATDLFHADAPVPFRLTHRESQALAGLIDGKSNAQIAADLGVRVDTVRALVATILGTMGAVNRTQAAVTALRLQSAEGYGHAASVAALLG